MNARARSAAPAQGARAATSLRARAPRAALLAAILAACGGGTAVAGGLDRGPDLAAYRDAESIRTLRGKASYYHDSLAGNTTANGEIYDPRLATAASRDLPFGTIVRVVRIDNRQEVIVRINDRGPFRRRERILDLSRAAAEQLDMIRAGVVDIRAEILFVPR